MAKVKVESSMSLDGSMAGPNDNLRMVRETAAIISSSGMVAGVSNLSILEWIWEDS
jgi:hypothetical protein